MKVTLKAWCLLALILVSSHGRALSSSLHGVLLDAGEEQCPDQKVCPSGNTCCEQVSGEYGCCQLPDAVCCSDKKSCCPSGTTCDLKRNTCDSTLLSLRSMLTLQPQSKTHAPDTPVAPIVLVPETSQLAKTKLDSPPDRLCPDRQTVCPDTNTCCLMPNNQWVCCPYPNAACCPDGYHCCQYGYHCDPTSRYCYRSSEDTVATWLTLIATNPQLKNKNKP